MPLLVRAPGVAPGRVVTPVSQVHLTPTLLDLLGLAVPGGLQGTSLRRCLRAATSLRTDAAPGRTAGRGTCPRTRPRSSLSGTAGISSAAQWQTAFGADPAQMAQPRSPVDARTIRRGRWKLSVYVTGEAELYDLRADPGEAHNLARRAEHRATVAALYERLRAWQRETGDTLALPDPVAPTAGSL